MEREQNSTLAHEDPVLTSEELDDKRRKLDRELLYLLNKLRSHPPPKLKKPLPKNTTTNTTTTSNTTTTTTAGGGDMENGADGSGPSKPENENKNGNGNEDGTVAGKDTAIPVEQDPTTQSTESGDKHDPIILSAADATDSIKSLPSPAGEGATSTDKDTKDRLEL